MNPQKNNTTRIPLALGTLCLMTSLLPAATIIDFEGDTVGQSLGDIGWSVSSDTSTVQVVTTATEGVYTGGKAIRTTNNTGATSAGLLVTQPGIIGLQMDVRWDVNTASTPTSQLSGWVDADSDGVYASGERTIGFAMDNDGDFEFLSVSSELDGDTTTTFSANIWYRLTMTWGAPNLAGDRVVTLNGFDLTNNTSLGVVNSMTMTSAQFGSDPSNWNGVGIRMTRGTFDNITLIPEPSAALLGGLGLLALLRRRR